MDKGFALDDLRKKHHLDRNDLLLAQGMEQAKLKAEWKQLDHDRRATSAEDERGRTAKASPGDNRPAAADSGQKSATGDPTPSGVVVEAQETMRTPSIEDEGSIDRLRRLSQQAEARKSPVDPDKTPDPEMEQD